MPRPVYRPPLGLVLTGVLAWLAVAALGTGLSRCGAPAAPAPPTACINDPCAGKL